MFSWISNLILPFSAYGKIGLILLGNYVSWYVFDFYASLLINGARILTLVDPDWGICEWIDLFSPIYESNWEVMFLLWEDTFDFMFLSICSLVALVTFWDWSAALLENATDDILFASLPTTDDILALSLLNDLKFNFKLAFWILATLSRWWI